MSGLIIEIQQGCLDDSISVESLLRRVKLAAAKLKLGDLAKWVDNELNGYQSEVPTHRILQGEPVAWDPHSGWTPIQVRDGDLSDLLSTAHLFQSIGSLRDLTSNNGEGLYHIPIAPKLVSKINKAMNYPTARIAIGVPRGGIVGIIDFVRNQVLDWSIKMEENGVLGEGLTFNTKEIESAKTSMNTYIFGSIGNFAGNIGDGNTSGDITLTTANTTEIRGKLQQLLDASPQLVAAGANNSLPATINAAIVETEKSEHDRPKMMSLIQDLRTALASAAGNLTADGAIAAVNGIAKMLGGG